jgi:hypothetical protein
MEMLPYPANQLKREVPFNLRAKKIPRGFSREFLILLD